MVVWRPRVATPDNAPLATGPLPAIFSLAPLKKRVTLVAVNIAINGPIP